jgi:CHRD domain-containing protein
MLKLIYNTDFNTSMKINTIFLLTVVGVFATFSLLTMLTTGTSFNAVAQSNETAAITINETAANPSNETAANPSNETAANHFTANLTAPAISSNSKATGNATFTLKDDGNTMSYVISGNGLANITQVVILQSTGGRTTDLVQPLYYAPTSGLYTKGSGSADGNFTSADFVNILKGKQMSDLVKKILDGHVYIAIKSVPFPLGEIAGKIQIPK